MDRLRSMTKYDISSLLLLLHSKISVFSVLSPTFQKFDEIYSTMCRSIETCIQRFQFLPRRFSWRSMQQSCRDEEKVFWTNKTYRTLSLRTNASPAGLINSSSSDEFIFGYFICVFLLFLCVVKCISVSNAIRRDELFEWGDGDVAFNVDTWTSQATSSISVKCQWTPCFAYAMWLRSKSAHICDQMRWSAKWEKQRRKFHSSYTL